MELSRFSIRQGGSKVKSFFLYLAEEFLSSCNRCLPRPKATKLFVSVIVNVRNEIECLSQAVAIITNFLGIIYATSGIFPCYFD
jgi:hypothetical protein